MAAGSISVQNRPGTKAKVKFVRMSASKVRVVLNLIRGKQVGEALEILQFSERLASQVVEKALRSAIANAEHNEDISEDELFVSACFANEGPTIKRFRPRARGRAGRIHKQTCHLTVEVSRLTDDELDLIRTTEELKSQRRSSAKSKSDGGDRAKRVAKSKAAAADEAEEAEEVTDEVAGDAEVADATSSDNEPSGEAGAADAEETTEEVAEDIVAEDIVDEVESDSEPEVAEATSSDEAPSADGADDQGEVK